MRRRPAPRSTSSSRRVTRSCRRARGGSGVGRAPGTGGCAWPAPEHPMIPAISLGAIATCGKDDDLAVGAARACEAARAASGRARARSPRPRATGRRRARGVRASPASRRWSVALGSRRGWRRRDRATPGRRWGTARGDLQGEPQERLAGEVVGERGSRVIASRRPRRPAAWARKRASSVSGGSCGPSRIGEAASRRSS